MTDIAIFWDASQLWGRSCGGPPKRSWASVPSGQSERDSSGRCFLTRRLSFLYPAERPGTSLPHWVKKGGKPCAHGCAAAAATWGSAAGPGLGFPMPPILCVPPKSVRACACARGTVRKSANACSTSFPGTSASVFRAGIRLSRNFFPNPSPPAPNRLSRSGGRGALRRHPGALTTGWTCWPGMLAPIPAPARRICAWPTCLSLRCPPPCSNNGSSCTASRWRPGFLNGQPLRPARAIRQGELYAQLQPFGDAGITGREPLVRTHPAHAGGIRAEGGYRPGVASR